MQLNIAYLINQYPKVSHSFIRREIHALERAGITVHRVAARGWMGELPDHEDRLEREKTCYLLKRGPAALALSLIAVLLSTPLRFGHASKLALYMARASARPLVYHLIYLAEACLLRRWMRGWGVQHVHVHFGTNGAEVAMLANALGGPSYSLTVHGPEEFDRPESLGLREIVQRSAFVAAISSFGRSQIYRWVPYGQWSKISVVHCGLERAFYDGFDGPPSAAPRLLCIGRLCEQKGQLLLVEAARQVRDRGVELELVLAGDGEMRSEIEGLISRHGLRDRVRITGWISGEQVRNELLACRALVLPSFAEGLPVVIMEAMSLRRPILSTYVAGIPELVCPESGWLFPAGDVQSLVDAILECLNTSVDTLAAMGEAARTFVLERHNVDIEVAKLIKLFARAAAPTPAA